MLKKLVALTLGVGLFCSAGICHAATIENYITDVKGTVTAVYLHKVTPGATGKQEEWVLIDTPNKTVSKTERVVNREVDLSTIDIPEGEYDIVAFDHPPFEFQGKVVVKDAASDIINGTYYSTKRTIDNNPEFAKDGNPQWFTDYSTSRGLVDAWKDLSKEEVGSYALEFTPNKEPGKAPEPSNIRVMQKLQTPLKISKGVDAEGKSVTYVDGEKSLDLSVRTAFLWAGKGWPDSKYSEPLNGVFVQQDNGKWQLDYGETNNEGKAVYYTWYQKDGIYKIHAPILDDIEIEYQK